MHKHIYLVGILLCALSNFAQAQTIFVTDQQDLRPVSEAIVYNGKQTIQVFTNHQGTADISGLKDEPIILIQHPGYQIISTTWADLQAAEWKISMIFKTHSLDEVVISSSRWQESQRDIINQVTKIKARDIAFINAPTTADIINSSGQVYVQKSQLGGGSPMLRGFSANSILLVIDGVRMNNAIYRSGNLQNIISVDANDLESAEVLFGPGSVLYGSDALGGVINFSTLKPRFERADSTKSLEGSAFMRYGSAMQEKSFHFDLNLATQYVAMATSFTYNDFGDLKTGRNRANKYENFGLRNSYVDWIGDFEDINPDTIDTIINNPTPNTMLGSAYRQWNFQHKISAQFSNNVLVDYGFYFTSSTDIPRYDKLVEFRNGLPRYAEWHYGPQQWEMHRGSIHLTNVNSLYSQAKLIVSKQYSEESREYRKYNSPDRIGQEEFVNVITVNLDFKKDFLNKSELYYGLEYLLNKVDSHGGKGNIITNEDDDFVSRYPDGGNTVKSYSAYSQFVHKPNERLTLSAGARLNKYVLNSLISSSNSVFKVPFNRIDIDNSALTGSLGAVLNFGTWRINTNLASGFRSPNLDDVGKVLEGVDFSIMVPNPDLGPEYSNSAELGVSKSFLDKITLNGNVYYTLINNAIERRDFMFNGKDSIFFNGDKLKVLANVNAGQAYVFGYTLNLQADLNQYFTLISSFTYTEGRNITNDIALRHIPPAFGRTTLSLKLDRWRTELYSEYAGNKPLKGLPPEELAKVGVNYTPKGTLSWASLNLRTSYQINKYLQMQGGIENIMDTYYHTFASGISAPGRNFSITLRGRF